MLILLIFFVPYAKFIFLFNFTLQANIKFIVYFNFHPHSFNSFRLFCILLYNWNSFFNVINEYSINQELNFIVFLNRVFQVQRPWSWVDNVFFNKKIGFIIFFNFFLYHVILILWSGPWVWWDISSWLDPNYLGYRFIMLT